MVKQNDDFFDDEHVPESNWMKFEKISDFIKGTLIKAPFIKNGEGDFEDQMVYQLKTTDVVINGKTPEELGIYNLGVKMSNTYVNDRLGRAKVGQVMGVLFEKEIPAKTKGYNPAKSLKPVLHGMDPDFNPEPVQGEDAEETADDEKPM